jgi:ABC-type uncharacterized transport system permease subunit
VLATTAIWFVKTWNATEVLRAALSAGRYPVSAFPPTLRLLFTLVLPVAFLTTVPAEILLGRSSGAWMLASLGVAIVLPWRSAGPSGCWPCAITPPRRAEPWPVPTAAVGR